MYNWLHVVLLIFAFYQEQEIFVLKKQIMNYEYIHRALDIQCITFEELSQRSNHINSLIGILKIYFNINSDLFLSNDALLRVRKFNETSYCTHGDHLTNQLNIKYSLQHYIIENLEIYQLINNITQYDNYNTILYLDKYENNAKEFIDGFAKTFL